MLRSRRIRTINQPAASVYEGRLGTQLELTKGLARPGRSTPTDSAEELQLRCCKFLHPARRFARKSENTPFEKGRPLDRGAVQRA